jgi:hypothetical protein
VIFQKSHVARSPAAADDDNVLQGLQLMADWLDGREQGLVDD